MILLTPCRAIAATLRALDFHRELGGRTRRTVVLPERLQREHSGLEECFGANVNSVTNTTCVLKRDCAGPRLRFRRRLDSAVDQSAH